MPQKLTALLFLAALLACAQSITVQNSSFENANLTLNNGFGPYSNLVAGTVVPLSGSLPDWTESGTTLDAFAGAWAPNRAQFPNWWVGNNVGYIYIVGGGTVSLSQALSTNLQNETSYTLSALIAAPPSPYIFNYSIQLWAGKTMLAAASNRLGQPGFVFGADSVTYYSGDNNPQAGQPLQIVLSATGSSGGTYGAEFDTVGLTVSNGPVATNVLPQLAYGGGWYTALYFTNLNGGPVSFPIYFFGDDGNSLNVAAANGTSTTVNLAGRGSAVIQIPNSGSLAQGYVTTALPAGVNAYGIFRQSVAGVPDQEAVVPLSGVTNTVSTLLFDETSYVTGVAIVNLSSTSNAVNATAYDSHGNVIGNATISLPANGKTEAVLTSIPGLSALAGVVGSIDFSVNTGNIAVLGLRFDGTAFTSIPTFDR
jgi:hypothetical protein